LKAAERQRWREAAAELAATSQQAKLAALSLS